MEAKMTKLINCPECDPDHQDEPTYNPETEICTQPLCSYADTDDLDVQLYRLREDAKEGELFIGDTVCIGGFVLLVLQRDHDGVPPFTYDAYYSSAGGVPVVHVDTDNLKEDDKGPFCRVYLNDDVIYENPPLPKEAENAK
jgi:hypothetical protein